MMPTKTWYDKVWQWLATGQWFSLGTPVSSANKTDRHDITESVESGVKHHKPYFQISIRSKPLICIIIKN
jgi:hypothetical protein